MSTIPSCPKRCSYAQELCWEITFYCALLSPNLDLQKYRIPFIRIHRLKENWSYSMCKGTCISGYQIRNNKIHSKLNHRTDIQFKIRTATTQCYYQNHAKSILLYIRERFATGRLETGCRVAPFLHTSVPRDTPTLGLLSSTSFKKHAIFLIGSLLLPLLRVIRKVSVRHERLVGMNYSFDCSLFWKLK